MDTTETGTIAVRGGHIPGCGHGEIAYIDYLGVGDIHSGVCVDAFGLPSFGVDIKFRFLFLFEKIVDKGFGLLNGDLVADVFLFGDEALMLGVVGFGEFERLCVARKRQEGRRGQYYEFVEFTKKHFLLTVLREVLSV